MAHVRKRVTNAGTVRYDVRWRLPDGSSRQRSFLRAKDAEAMRRQLEHEELQEHRIDPGRGEMTLQEYAEQWYAERRKADGRPLAPRTREIYRSMLDRFILPTFGRRQLTSIRTADIRRWHSSVAEGVSPMQAAKSYRLLRVILNTAVEDERIVANPCKIRGAGVERSPERPFVDAEVVLQLAANIDERYSALVLLAGFGGLRLGELLGLRRKDLDLRNGRVRVEQQTVELKGGERITSAPKSDAGRRIVAIPNAVAAALDRHLAAYTRDDPDAPVFTGPLSEGLRRATLYKEWALALKRTGLEGIHLHDLRHAAGTLAAQQGASVRELMARLGHASPAASARYQHAAERRDSVIAAALDAVMREAQAMADSRVIVDASTTEPRYPRVIPGSSDTDGLPEAPENPPDQGFSGASDGNRTRVLSLGS